MSRLLFAAARGARIQKTNVDGEWRPTLEAPLIDTSECAFSWRIHPDDTHLQYGPISTAIQDYARCDYMLRQTFPHLALSVLIETPYADRWMLTWIKQTKLERSLALLILAEALADEGL